MKNLYEYYANEERSLDDKFNDIDIIHKAVHNGVIKSNSPKDINIEDDGTVTIIGNDEDLSYQAPECVLDDAEADKNSALFTFGLILYFIMNGKNYYDANNLSVMDLDTISVENKSLIGFSDENFQDGREVIIRKAMAWYTCFDRLCRSEGENYFMILQDTDNNGADSHDGDGSIEIDLEDFTNEEDEPMESGVSLRGGVMDILNTEFFNPEPTHTVNPDNNVVTARSSMVVKYLAARTKNNGAYIKVFDYGVYPAMKTFVINRNTDTTLYLVTVEQDFLTGNIEFKGFSTSITIPKKPRNIARLNITSVDDSRIDIKLFDSNNKNIDSDMKIEAILWET